MKRILVSTISASAFFAFLPSLSGCSTAGHASSSPVSMDFSAKNIISSLTDRLTDTSEKNPNRAKAPIRWNEYSWMQGVAQQNGGHAQVLDASIMADESLLLFGYLEQHLTKGPVNFRLVKFSPDESGIPTWERQLPKLSSQSSRMHVLPSGEFVFYNHHGLVSSLVTEADIDTPAFQIKQRIRPQGLIDAALLTSTSRLYFSHKIYREAVVISSFDIKSNADVDVLSLPIDDIVLESVVSMVADDDGRLFAGWNGHGLLRINADGSSSVLDTLGSVHEFQSMALDKTSGVLWIALSEEDPTQEGGVRRNSLVRLKTTGQLLSQSNFSELGLPPGTGERVIDMLVQANGKVLCATSEVVYRLNQDASLDQSFKIITLGERERAQFLKDGRLFLPKSGQLLSVDGVLVRNYY